MTRSIRTLCPNCATEADCTIVRRPLSFEFRGKTYQSEEEFARCGNCSAEFDMFGLDDPLTKVYEQYRREHGYPTPQEIRAARERMRLTEEEFGRLLDTHARTIRLYERGALPSEAHAELLKDIVMRQMISPSGPENSLASIFLTVQKYAKAANWPDGDRFNLRPSVPSPATKELPLAA